MKDNRLKEQVFRTIREALIERNDTPYCDTHVEGSPFIDGKEDD